MRDFRGPILVPLFTDRDGCLVARFINTVTHRGRRGARPARREEGEYREYLTDEQRRGTGCIGGRMQTNFRDTTLASHSETDGLPEDAESVLGEKR